LSQVPQLSACCNGDIVGETTAGVRFGFAAAARSARKRRIIASVVSLASMTSGTGARNLKST